MTYLNYFTLVENKPFTIVPDSTSKREKIRELISEGNHSAKNIAEMVNTTVAYVWKEKSRFKNSGLSIRRDTKVISSKSQLKVYGSNNALLNVPQLDPEGVKTLFSQFSLGNKPAQIISEYGFHPELVEIEYQRFLRLENEYDIYTLQTKFFQKFEQQLLGAKNNNAVNSLVEKYRKDGKLVADEFIALINLMQNERFQFGKVSAIEELINNIPPAGWQSGRCINCNGVVSHCIEDPIRKLRITISDTFIPLTHKPPCRA